MSDTAPSAPPPSYDEAVNVGGGVGGDGGAPYPTSNYSQPPVYNPAGYPTSMGPPAGGMAPYQSDGSYPPSTQYTHPVASGGFSQPASRNQSGGYSQPGSYTQPGGYGYSHPGSYNQPGGHNQTGQYTYNTVTVAPNVAQLQQTPSAQQLRRRRMIFMLFFFFFIIAIIIIITNIVVRQ